VLEASGRCVWWLVLSERASQLCLVDVEAVSCGILLVLFHVLTLSRTHTIPCQYSMMQTTGASKLSDEEPLALVACAT
jgi:hypothetical protein